MNSENSQPESTKITTHEPTGIPTFYRIFRPDRPSPYLLQWGKRRERRTEAFRSPGDRERRFKELVKQYEKPDGLPVFSRQQLADYAEFLRATKGHSWIEVVAGWRENCERRGKSASTRTVADAVKACVEDAEARQKRGEISLDTLRQKRHKLTMFAEEFGTEVLSAVTAKDIEKWIDGFGWSSAGTFNAYRKHLLALFNFFSKEVPANPVVDVRMRDDAVDTVGILTPKETARLFAYAKQHYPESLGRLALEAFAGLRFSSAMRLSKEDINFAEKGILLPKNKIKTKRRFYLDGLPDNLWAWLALTNDACWAMENSEWMHLKSRIFREAGVRHPRNCLRHSFCTYHVAAYKDPGKTATILCHRNQSLLWDHYYGVGTQAAGVEYFSITPENCSTLAGAA